MRIFIFLVGSIFCLGNLNAQNSNLPRVFLLGQEESAYESLAQNYKQSLLEACNSDMQLAFDKWLKMMQDMEAYAEKIDFDIKGVKILVHVFWNENGGVDYLGFFIRPDSRNVDPAELKAFFTSFIANYKLDVTSSKKFAHYTKASFPTFSERAQRD